jgi:hypothetical protein
MTVEKRQVSFAECKREGQTEPSPGAGIPEA